MFSDSDLVINDLTRLMTRQNDEFIASRYTGFVAVSAVTIFEVKIKTLFIGYARRVNPILGNYVSTTMERLNAHIKRKDLEEYLSRFDAAHVERFKKFLNQKEEECVTNRHGSIKSAYANLLQWRHEFVHAGNPPSNATFSEVVDSYRLGKEVIIALEKVLSAEQHG